MIITLKVAGGVRITVWTLKSVHECSALKKQSELLAHQSGMKCTPKINHLVHHITRLLLKGLRPVLGEFVVTIHGSTREEVSIELLLGRKIGRNVRTFPGAF